MTAGALMCLASAVAFGAMGIFGKLAYGEGTTVGTLLAARFAIAAALFWALVAATGALRDVRRLRRSDVLAALALGAVGYSLQAGAYFTALRRLDASLLSLVLYTFPGMVTVAEIALGRERASRRTTGALVVASGGLVLVLAGAGTGAIDGVGAALGIAAALVYTTYILGAAMVADRVAPLVLSALVATGAAATLTGAGVADGSLQPGRVSAAGLGWLAGIAVVSTVGAVSLFFAGLRRVGPTRASIISTAEPLTAVVLAFAAFGETMTAVQLAGGALVLGAVVVLSVRAPAQAEAEPVPAAAGAVAPHGRAGTAARRARRRASPALRTGVRARRRAARAPARRRAGRWRGGGGA
jgi:drug/metabolite transporter (DMT)-like permease